MTGESRLRGFGVEVGRAQGVVEIAKLVCVETKRLFDLDHCIVSLYAASGRPLITIDNRPDLTDELRLRSLGACAWRGDALLSAMLDCHAPVCGALLDRVTWLVPIIGSAGVLGSFRCEHSPAIAHAIERELFLISMLVSVRLAHLGITAVQGPPAVSQLTPRQHEVARLAARGLTNGEIGEALQISPNTVKNRLKEVFDRLDVLRRVELVHAFDGLPKCVDVPIGISHDGDFTIACVAGA